MSQNRTVFPALVCWLCASSLGACQDPLAELEPGGGQRIRVELSDGAPLDQASSVFRFRLNPAPASLDDLVLFQDELSSYYRRSVAAGDIPESLAQRRIPLLAWSAGTTEAFAQPTQALPRGAVYVLALLEHGVLAQVITGGPEAPLLERVWPRQVGGAFGGVYCLEPAYELASFTLTLAPGDVSGDFAPFEFARECASLSVAEAAGVRVPAPAAGGVLIDPAPLVELQGVAVFGAAVCVEPCTALGPGCLCAEDDRAVIHGPSAPAFWVVDVDARSARGETSAEVPFVVTELSASTSYALTGAVFDLAGRLTPLVARFQTEVARARVVINEVYANAEGPEPDQEWVELVNAGTLSTTLAGYVLEDVGGAAALPDVELAPGAYALVVNASYTPDPDYDLVPPGDAVRVVVERLGKNGLSNEGEALRLSAPDGTVVSRFPGQRASEPGISAARRTPLTDDAAVDAFAPHGAPGASPGALNFFDLPE